MRANYIFSSVKKHVLSSFFLMSALCAFSENFRVRNVLPLHLQSLTEKITVDSGINDALFITVPDDLTYVSGVELTLKIPEEIATWRDSVAYMFYEHMSPAPTEKQQNYTGERVYLDTIPGKLSLTIYVPISKDFSIKDSPYSVRTPLFSDARTEGIFMRFMMVMKGVPESLETSIISIMAKPVLKDKGSLSLSITPSVSDEKKYSVFIDDVPVQNYANTLLATGEHHLSVISDAYRNELRTFRVEQAKTTALSITLRGIEPLLKVFAPKDTLVYLDDEPIKVTSEAFVVSQGEHAVKLILGDYEIVKTVSVQNGRTYTVNLNVDATISEEN